MTENQRAKHTHFSCFEKNKQFHDDSFAVSTRQMTNDIFHFGLKIFDPLCLKGHIADCGEGNALIRQEHRRNLTNLK